MDNRILTKEDMLFAPHEPATAPKMKEKPKKLKKNVYKVWTQYATDRSKAMQTIFEEDEKAEFKHKDRWTFKVKTALTLNDMNRIFIYERYEYGIKKALFF